MCSNSTFDEQDRLITEHTTVNDARESEEGRLLPKSLILSSVGVTFAPDTATDRIQVQAQRRRYGLTKDELLVRVEAGPGFCRSTATRVRGS